MPDDQHPKTVGDFLSLVETLPESVLRDYLMQHDPEQDATAHTGMATAAVDELLRRERERCAVECETTDVHGFYDINPPHWHPNAEETLDAAAARIRGLQ